MVCGILKSLGRFGKYKFQLRPRNVMQNQHSNWVEGFYEWILVILIMFHTYFIAFVGSFSSISS